MHLVLSVVTQHAHPRWDRSAALRASHGLRGAALVAQPQAAVWPNNNARIISAMALITCSGGTSDAISTAPELLGPIDAAAPQSRGDWILVVQQGYPHPTVV